MLIYAPYRVPIYKAKTKKNGRKKEKKTEREREKKRKKNMRVVVLSGGTESINK